MINGFTLIVIFIAIIGGLYYKSTIEPDNIYQTENQTINDWKNSGSFYVTKLGSHSIFYKNLLNKNAIRDETLVIIHGFPSSSLDFVYVLPELQKYFSQVVLFDHIGFGLSSKPSNNLYAYSIHSYCDNVVELLNFLNIRKAHILSHDMGDSVAIELLSRQYLNQLPDFFEGGLSYTFTNGGMRIELSNFRLSQIILKAPYISKIFAYFGHNKFLFERNIRSISGSKYQLKQHDLDVMLEGNLHNNGYYRFPDSIQYLNDRYKFQNPRWMPAIKNFVKIGKVKVSFIWGDEDDVAPLSIANKMHDEVKPSNLIVLKNIGHFYMLEAPEEFVKAFLSIFI